MTEGGLPVCDQPKSQRGDGWLRGKLREKSSQLRRRFELGNGVQFLECAGERVREAPHRPRRELFVLGLEVQPVHFGEKTPGRFQLAVHKRGIEDQLRSFVSDLRLTPLLHLTTHRLEASLNPINAYRERVDQIEALGVLRQDGRELAAKRHVRANEHTQARGQPQPD